jgi:hypothetical protein
MLRRYLKWIFLGLGVLFVLLLLMPALRGRHAGFRVKAQHEWIQKTMQELALEAPPSIGQNGQNDVVWWNSPGYLLFSNGWAAYRLHTIHDGEDVGDTSVLRTSDGNFYLSEAHFCVGIGELLSSELDRDPNSPRPTDVHDFLAHYGNFQGWALLGSKAELPWCVVSCPDREDTHTQKKPLWVWISSGAGTNQTTLFENRYTVAGSYVSWSITWLSSESCVVDIYDYGRNNSPDLYREACRSNHITSLTLRRDGQTGKFTDKD